MTETLTLTNTRDLYVALADCLQLSMGKVYEQVTARGEPISNLAVYATEYLRAMTQTVADTLASEGLITNADDDLLALWDYRCHQKGLLEQDGQHWFPSAQINFRDATDLEPPPALPAPPSISAADVAEIVSTAVEKVISAIKETADKGDVVIQRDSAGQVTGVRRSKATD